MQDARIRLALAVLGLLALGGGGFALYSARRAAPPVVITAPQTSANPNPTPQATNAPTANVPKTAPTNIYVDVSGAVRHPWLYALPAGSRVMKAVLAAGGPTQQADLDAVNLAEPLKDGEKVYVPLKQSHTVVTVQKAPPGNVIGYAPPKALAPITSAAAALPTILEPAQTTASVPVGILKKQKTKSGSKGDKITSSSQGQIALNTADATQLERLPGVGPAMAARIVAFRDQAHGFQSIQELQEVDGIGVKKFAKIAPFITLN
jgi:competence protein ComEA